MKGVKEYLIEVLEISPEEQAEKMLARRQAFLHATSGAAKTAPPTEQREEFFRLQQKISEIRWKLFRIPPEQSRKKLLKLTDDKLKPYPELLAQRDHLLKVCELCTRWDAMESSPGMYRPFLEWTKEWIVLPAREAGVAVNTYLYDPEQNPEQIRRFQNSARLFLTHIDPNWQSLRSLLQQIIDYRYWQSIQVSTEPASTQRTPPGWVFVLIFMLLFRIVYLFLMTK